MSETDGIRASWTTAHSSRQSPPACIARTIRRKMIVAERTRATTHSAYFRNLVTAIRFNFFFERVEFRLLGFQSQRGLDFRLSGCGIVLFEQGFREKKMRLRIARIDVFRVTKPSFGLAELRSLERDDAEIVESALVFRIEFEHVAIK